MVTANYVKVEGIMQENAFVGTAQIIQAVTPIMYRIRGDSAYSDV